MPMKNFVDAVDESGAKVEEGEAATRRADADDDTAPHATIVVVVATANGSTVHGQVADNGKLTWSLPQPCLSPISPLELRSIRVRGGVVDMWGGRRSRSVLCVSLVTGCLFHPQTRRSAVSCGSLPFRWFAGAPRPVPGAPESCLGTRC